MSLHKLEELGFALLKRSRAGIRLTGEGERMISPVRDLLGSAERLKQTASSIRGLESGTVRIGAFTSVAVHWLPAVLKEFQQDYPRVDFRLLNGDYHDVEQWLQDGSIDIGFVNVPCALDCECIPLMEDRLLAILPRGSRFENFLIILIGSGALRCGGFLFSDYRQPAGADARPARRAAWTGAERGGRD